MPTGVRTSLIAILIGLGATAQAVADPATTWTDPPAKRPETAKVTPGPTVPQTPAAVSTPRRDTASVVRKRHAPPHRVAARPIHQHVAQAVHRVPHRASRVVSMAPTGPVVRRYGYPVYSEAGFPPSYEDERLDRLSTAVGSGYLVMRRRTVEYPDGRVIRYFRPADDDGME